MRTDITKLTAILRFVITFVVVLFTLAYLVILFWIKIPTENRDLVNFVAGGIITNGWVLIIKWWFPSDLNSERKTELLAKADSIKE
jgi:hypothetical protein